MTLAKWETPVWRECIQDTPKGFFKVRYRDKKGRFVKVRLGKPRLPVVLYRIPDARTPPTKTARTKAPVRKKVQKKKTARKSR